MSRSPGQKTLTISLSEQLMSAMDHARKEQTKSEYVREALAEKLASEGYKISGNLIEPPSRKGVGGKPTHKVFISHSHEDEEAAEKITEQMAAEPNDVEVRYREATRRREVQDDDCIVERSPVVLRNKAREELVITDDEDSSLPDDENSKHA